MFTRTQLCRRGVQATFKFFLSAPSAFKVIAEILPLVGNADTIRDVLSNEGTLIENGRTYFGNGSTEGETNASSCGEQCEISIPTLK